MTAEQLPPVSVIDPVSPAFEKVKTILFRPFDLNKWFAIGFCAWLAYLGRGGLIPNFSFRKHRPDFHPHQFFRQAENFILENIYWLIPAVIIAVMLIIILSLVITWLSSRGRFMFLHCIALNKAEVKIPWRKFRQHANSLFLFRVVLGIIAIFSTGLLCVPVLFLVAAMVNSGIGLNVISLIGVIISSLFLVVLSIIFFLIQKLTTDFVVPIMFLRTTSCSAAWQEFLQILFVGKKAFTLYILFQIVISIVIVAIIFAAACVTCCCAACLLSIPYLGIVLMLPLLIFKRAYSLLYFRQFGPRFDVFAA
jgi:hypothetical protein